MKFEHKVSKGSSYNQIYIPREMEQYFEAGDLVEVRLIKKVSKLYYNHLKEADLSDFKRKLIEGVFNNLQNIKRIEQIFVFGSFLTNNVDYNDIDIMILTEKENQEEKIYNGLIAEFNLKFHIISVPKNKLEELLIICPLTRSMLYYFVSNKNFKIPKDTRIDENHIRFLLMMPEDLLKVGLDDGKVYYDSLRKLVTIENFLKNNEIAPNLIDLELEKLMRKDKLMFIKEDNVVKGAIRKEIEGMIREKLDLIYKYLKNVKKR